MDGSAPPEPDPPPMLAAPMAEGMIDDQPVGVGDTKMVDASMYFTGTELTYSVESDDEATATATVDRTSGMVTITGVAQGDTTITVTATNSAGSDTQDIDVMVTEPSHTPNGVQRLGNLDIPKKGR